MYKAIIVFLLCLLFVPLVNANGSEQCKDIKFKLMSVGVGIGGTWGNGELTIGNSPNEQTYYFTAGGFSLAEVGVAMFSTTGKVCGLSDGTDYTYDIAKLPGIYGGVGGGIAVLPGYGYWTLWNQNGVSITLNSSFHGIFVGLPIKSLILTLQ
jgi:hypothetical protein